MSELLVKKLPVVTGAARLRTGNSDIGIDSAGFSTDADELAVLDLWVAARVANLLVPVGADVTQGGHIPNLPFSARGSQEGPVSIFASGENRAFSATIGTASG